MSYETVKLHFKRVFGRRPSTLYLVNECLVSVFIYCQTCLMDERLLLDERLFLARPLLSHP